MAMHPSVEKKLLRAFLCTSAPQNSSVREKKKLSAMTAYMHAHITAQKRTRKKNDHRQCVFAIVYLNGVYFATSRAPAKGFMGKSRKYDEDLSSRNNFIFIILPSELRHNKGKGDGNSSSKINPIEVLTPARIKTEARSRSEGEIANDGS